jgi:uncharacterized DUF497 family protein
MLAEYDIMIFNWDEEKNKKLQIERGVSFEEVVFAIEDGRLLDVLEHPNQEKYGGQKLYVVAVNRYAYIVPFADKGNERFLKTTFPSRKYTKIFIKKEK